MIEFLRGKIAYRESDYLVLDVAGIGYRVFCPNPYAFQENEDKNLTVFTHHHVREDAILLFGFPNREQQSLFRKLLEVSGIGPRVALGILSAGSPDRVIASIRQEDVAYLTKLPGIGRKTAQRIILDLKDKLGKEKIAAGIESPVSGGGSAAAGEWPGAWSEAKEGLLALGYSEAETDRVWQSIRAAADETDTAETLLKKALKALFQG
ncbi:Holliday junction branch migration protein RuvA [Ferviditalea candida]|uniref:Holliday junction branch migration complex subunit RuvA n=1 Tax=Ferviditalea candida TaxID=3108399 RepID=A0ABU5ZHQ6_9BACL|nr:Holliday junction branch migration protein RuvA [Paenibacillaceae bacterium T2]